MLVAINCIRRLMRNTKLDYNSTIQRLKDILNDPNCLRLNMSTIKGYLGELYVLQKLEKEGRLVVLKGKQSSYDLLVDGDISIDVKSSTIKGSKKYPDWGWALRTKGLDKIKNTHFVCVAYNENYDVVKFVTINTNDLEEFPDVKGRFNSVKRSFSLMLDDVDFPDHEYFKACEEMINKKKVKVINFDENLSECLNTKYKEVN